MTTFRISTYDGPRAIAANTISYERIDEAKQAVQTVAGEMLLHSGLDISQHELAVELSTVEGLVLFRVEIVSFAAPALSLQEQPSQLN